MALGTVVGVLFPHLATSGWKIHNWIFWLLWDFWLPSSGYLRIWSWWCCGGKRGMELFDSDCMSGDGFGGYSLLFLAWFAVIFSHHRHLHPILRACNEWFILVAYGSMFSKIPSHLEIPSELELQNLDLLGAHSSLNLVLQWTKLISQMYPNA
jgi:hypothetical protein